MGLSEARQVELMELQHGQRGGILLTDTTAITGKFGTMVVLASAAFTVLTSEYTKNGTSTASTGADWGTLAAGTIISGELTAVTLASGTVLLIV